MLTKEQLETIAEVDSPEWNRSRGTNIGEKQPSVFRVGSKILILKRLPFTSPRGHEIAYFPALAKTRELSASESQWLDDMSGEEEFPESLQSATIPDSGWQFPSIPENPRLDNVRTRTLVLNPTEQCNIRCTYCYYGGAYNETRTHRTLAPSDEALKLAINGFITNEQRLIDEQRAIYFFGGEPILGFKKMQTVIRLVEERKKQLGLDLPNLIYQVNTNALLINESIMSFLVKNDIYINVSIDGPNHDIYRLDRRGRGTHDRVRAKVDWMEQNWPEFFAKRVAIIGVLSSPLNAAAMYRYFASWETAHRALAWDFDLVLPGGDASYTEFESVSNEQQKIWDLFVDSHRFKHSEREHSLRYHFSFSHGFLHRSFHQALHHQGSTAPNQVETLLGVQLIPGSALVLLGADEKYYNSYEHQSEAFMTGTAQDGIDYNVGVNQIREFSEGIESSSCKTCWASRMCTVALAEAPFTSSDVVEKTKEKASAKLARCRIERSTLTQALVAVETIKQRYGSDRIEEHVSEWNRQKKEGPSRNAFYKASES